MLTIFDALRNITPETVLLRLWLAFLCGGAIGMERSFKNRPAGIRTHILICIGGAMAAMTGLYLYLNAGLSTDISRIGASVVSGLGFIGAGTIIVTKDQTIKGLTTAAGLWASGIIGVALGSGYYEGGIAATVLILLTESCFTSLSKRIPYTPEFRLALRYRHKLALDQVLRYCKDKRLSITDLQVTGSGDSDAPVYNAVISLRARGRLDMERLLEHIRSVPEILNVEELTV
ncbi:MAG: MgtC/SapB family protein [Oscillospiraceae bacterium]|nr:MgtC/SapB family protein [Oscillospiraceae bacterium]MBQ9719589.1 MgtC/SapB family protein [Oscillospiraceae bacterium]